MKKSMSSQKFKLAFLGAALALSGAALASQGSTSHSHDRAGHHVSKLAKHHLHSHWQHRGMKHGRGGDRMLSHRSGLVVPGYGVVSKDFVDGMGLAGDQLKLIEEARQASKELRESRKERYKDQRNARLERFKEPINPSKALEALDKRNEQAHAERRRVAEKWIAAWNALDSAQQERVAEHLKQRAEKMQKRAEKRAQLQADRQKQAL